MINETSEITDTRTPSDTTERLVRKQTSGFVLKRNKSGRFVSRKDPHDSAMSMTTEQLVAAFATENDDMGDADDVAVLAASEYGISPRRFEAMKLAFFSDT